MDGTAPQKKERFETGSSRFVKFDSQQIGRGGNNCGPFFLGH